MPTTSGTQHHQSVFMSDHS